MNKPTLPKLALVTKPQKATRTVVDTILLSPELIDSWVSPPFQRPVKINQRVLDVALEIKETEVVPGIMTLGVLAGKTYLLDGQHRREAFKLAELTEGFADVRIHHFESMADMGEEFVRLNSQLVKLKPDDILRGLEGSMATVAFIRKECPFIGYDQIRRAANSPVVSMSQALRCWVGSQHEVPKAGAGSAAALAKALSMDEAELMVSFFKHAYAAWGKDPEYARVWSTLNLTLSMWIFRKMVLTQWSPRVPKMTREVFSKCLQALTADTPYLDWLLGRSLTERDRSPAWARIKSIFVKRLEQEWGKKVPLPSPAWSSH